MATIWQDFNYGLWIATRNPIFSLVVVLTLALGIGANAAIFSVVNAVLLRPLAYPQSDRLVMLFSAWPGQGIPLAGSALPDYRVYRDQNRTLEDLAAVFSANVNLPA